MLVIVKPLQVSVDVQNIGLKDGEEVVELYLSNKSKKKLSPITSLKGFQRIMLTDITGN